MIKHEINNVFFKYQIAKFSYISPSQNLMQKKLIFYPNHANKHGMVLYRQHHIVGNIDNNIHMRNLNYKCFSCSAKHPKNNYETHEQSLQYS